MEDSFKVRVDKIFGSLSSSSASTVALNPSLSSLWCLTDDEIERREWIKEKDLPEPEPEPSPFFAGGRKLNDRNSRGFGDEFEDDLETDLDENPESNGSCSKFPKPDDYGDEEWEIKSSIGRDCTLDYEEEEDHYDKVAVGKEKVGDRLYMKDITDCGVEIDSCTELPTSLRNFTRDPRANHLAAKVRLKEDAEALKTTDSLRVSENGALADSEFIASQNPKSILKRKDNHLDSKPQKRVRFDPECKISSGQESPGSRDISMDASYTPEATEVANKARPSSQDYPTQVPDYVQNPSRYTCYTFDASDDVDEESNKKAYMDFLQMVRGSKTMESQLDNASISPPKSITFIPKKKAAGDTVMLENSPPSAQNRSGVGKETMHQRGVRISITAVDTQADDICSMEEDEPDKLESRRISSQKPGGRQYRLRVKMDSEEET